ncbi:hypothetical protein BN946_scf184816.g3 [Trametes cinnabarina]|uniref:Fungal-type protein kinase domain-containing protein n=1 Tax=Pycnoporus cinnabarinus TaxID=5643 RepID=A0A060SJ20_PYCCI|nr:hypothetical protein BN946_scf184816.g3 [Trametes cinnabarina]
MYAYAEIKNELGLDGMCEVQVAATYQWAIALLEVGFSPFVDFIFLGGDPDAEDRIERVAKIFVEVRNALEELKVWYQAMLANPIEHCCPHSSSWIASTTQVAVARAGSPSSSSTSAHPSSAQGYTANQCPSSSASATESTLTASSRRMTPPLAPKLHACVPLVGGPIMVVMDIVPGGKTAWKQYGKTQPLPDPAADDIETALAVLGEKGLVHGDVRRPNVMTVQRADGKTGGMLIGFDWAGKDGEVCYPSSLKKDVDWQPCVQPAQPIRPAHDWEMWRALKRGAV